MYKRESNSGHTINWEADSPDAAETAMSEHGFSEGDLLTEEQANAVNTTYLDIVSPPIRIAASSSTIMNDGVDEVTIDLSADIDESEDAELVIDGDRFQIVLDPDHTEAITTKKSAGETITVYANSAELQNSDTVEIEVVSA